MLGRSLKMAFWVTYDHIGKLILCSLVWSIPVSLFVFLALGAFATGDPSVTVAVGVPCLVVGLGVLMPVLSAGMCHMAKVLIDKRDGSVLDMFRGIRRFGLRAAGLGLSYVFIMACLATSVWFYAAWLDGGLRWLGYALSALALWVLLFAALTTLMAFPALVQKGEGLAATAKLSALLVLDNPLLMVGVLLQVVGIAAVSLAVPPIFFFLGGAMLWVLLSSVYELMARKYAVLAQDTPRAVAGQGPPMPLRDEEDEYLNRGFRDFLFPWKG